MKKIGIVSLLLAMMGMAMANPVSQDVARRVAQTWMQAQGMKNPAALQDITAQTPFTEFYVFAAPEGGFVLVSGDDCVVPVLAYSLENRFVAENMPQNVLAFLEGYEAEIRWNKNHQFMPTFVTTAPANEDEAAGRLPDRWRQLLDGAVPPPPLSTAVSPLMTTTWDQSPYYNALCPDDNSGYGNAVTGCVATATSQVMKYHNYPTTGYGSHTYSTSYQGQNATYTYNNLTANFGATTYQWTQMPNELTSSSSTAQVNAVATLMYHVGVADEMNYSPEESGAQNYNSFGTIRNSSQTSLMKYFKYRPDMAVLHRGDESDAAFSARLRAELDQSRPILYSGSDPAGGHSFVLDGYNASGQFHVNWGWGGYQDGYYAVGALNPGEGGTGGNATYTFNLRNAALIGIRPNTSWSTSGTTTFSVSAPNAPSGCSANVYRGGVGPNYGTQGTNYSFGDTVMLYATTSDPAYRFNGWSDGDHNNPREMIATGGSYSFTASFASIGNDTLSYCPSRAAFSAYSMNSGTTPWGVHFPASVLNSANSLAAVEFYAYFAGTYTITVYTGVNHSTTAATFTCTVGSGDAGSWVTAQLPSSVPATDDIWIMFTSTGASYPASFTAYGGYNGSCVIGSDFSEYGDYYQSTFMINGIFSSAVDNSGDTVSYCGNSAPASAVGNSNGGTFQWGVMFPTGTLTNNYLKSVMLYVRNDQTGDYTLNVYRGGDTVPGTLAHSQTVTFTDGGWQEALLNAPFAIGSDNIWITFTHTGTYPMMVCAYTGAPNSDWLNNGGTWTHLNSLGLNYSWLIKAVTSATASGSYPPPTIAIDGQLQVGKGMAYTFTATATSGANVSWSFQGGSPSTATGTTATTTWNTAGTYNIIATATNAYGVGRDTLTVTVVDYTAGDTVSYVLDREHITNVGASGADFGWGIMMPAAFLTGRTQLSGIKAVISEVGSYTLTVYQGGDNTPQTQIGTYTMNVTTADTGHYMTYTFPTPLAISSASNLWVAIYSTGMNHPAGAAYHTSDPNSDWTYYNNAWYHLPQLGLSYSWEIKLLMGQSSPQPTQYTITVGSNNSAWGTVTGGGTYNAGATATLTATAASGYRFAHWQDGNTQNPRTITVTGNATFTATFEAIPPTQYTITANANNANYGTVSGGGTYAVGTTVTLTATPNEGYRFVRWQQDNSTDNPRTITVTGNATYTAVFQVIPHYNITATSNNINYGSVSGSGTYYQGDTVTLTATPANGYRFVQWQDGNTDNPRTIVVTGTRTYIATFEAIPVQYTITVMSNDTSYGTVSGGGTYEEGTTIQLTATPNSGYRFVSWNDSNTDNPRSITVNADATYIATFEAIPPTQYTVSLNIGWLYGYAPGYYDTNEVYVTGAGTYVEGTEVTITASWGIADYICFVSWVTDAGDTLLGNTYTFTVTRDISFTAVYTGCGGIEELGGSKMSLTPNPATNIATISGLKAGAEVSLVDINGKVRYSGTAQGDRMTLDVSGMAAGVYFVRVSDGTETAVRKLIVK